MRRANRSDARTIAPPPSLMGETISRCTGQDMISEAMMSSISKSPATPNWAEGWSMPLRLFFWATLAKVSMGTP